MYKVCIQSHIGSVRTRNEDNYMVLGRLNEQGQESLRYEVFENPSVNGLVAVLDGMGGEAFGAEASAMSSKILKGVNEALEDLLESGLTESDVIQKYIQEANKNILDYKRQINGKTMGTTVSGVLVNKDTFTPFNLGDSRVYHLNEGNLSVLTTDHTEANRLLKLGLIDEVQYASHPFRNKLTGHLGIPEIYGVLTADIFESFKLESGGLLLLCTDGVHQYFENVESLEKLMVAYSDVEQLAQVITAQVLERGASDNFTFVLIKKVSDNGDSAVKNGLRDFLKKIVRM